MSINLYISYLYALLPIHHPAVSNLMPYVGETVSYNGEIGVLKVKWLNRQQLFVKFYITEDEDAKV